jgi:hypothetical protein
MPVHLLQRWSGSMPATRQRLLRALLAAVLIVAALAAGHQHRIDVPHPEAVLSPDDGGLHGTPKVTDCVVCRALRSTNLPAAELSGHVVVAANPFIQLVDEAAVERPRRHRSPRAPPTLHA